MGRKLYDPNFELEGYLSNHRHAIISCLRRAREEEFGFLERAAFESFIWSRIQQLAYWQYRRRAKAPRGVTNETFEKISKISRDLESRLMTVLGDLEAYDLTRDETILVNKAVSAIRELKIISEGQINSASSRGRRPDVGFLPEEYLHELGAIYLDYTKKRPAVSRGNLFYQFLFSYLEATEQRYEDEDSLHNSVRRGSTWSIRNHGTLSPFSKEQINPRK
jgi:hypothetical protein